MGYDIRIGLKMTRDDGSAFVVDEVNLSAPAFSGDDDCHHRNVRSPSYVAWSNFAGATGLGDLFFAPGAGLLANHPGLVDLTPEHLAAVRAALSRHVGDGLPERAPGFGDGLDYTLARLLWLEWWMAWALDQPHPSAVENW